MNFNIFKYTNKGSRRENQDSIGYKQYEDFIVACVADGVGGNNGGRFASQKSVQDFLLRAINKGVSQECIVKDIHKSILALQKKNEANSKMATTFTSCIVADSKIQGVHLGDSRLCLLRRNGLKQLTLNHTEVNRLIRAGKLTKEEAKSYPRKNVLESAIGINGELQIQNFNFNIENGDRILLTTDGVHEIISKVEFRDLSIQHSELKDYGNAIIRLLETKKVTDNLTFMLIEIKDENA